VGMVELREQLASSPSASTAEALAKDHAEALEKDSAEALEEEGAAQPGSPDAAMTVAYEDYPPPAGRKRKLEAHNSLGSNVSVDSSGFPSMLQESPHEIPQSLETPSFLRRRLGSSGAPGGVAWTADQEDPSIRDAMGYKAKAKAPPAAKAKTGPAAKAKTGPTAKAKAALAKGMAIPAGKAKAAPQALATAAFAKSKAAPAAKATAALAKGKAAPAAKAKAAPGGKAAAAAKAKAAPAARLRGEARVPWVKLRKTHAKKPERSYITGTQIQGGKLHLIVEVTRARSSRYADIVERIIEDLEKESITKPEALGLRDTLCEMYP
jgi:NADH-quinone oxidoreductase subunit C